MHVSKWCVIALLLCFNTSSYAAEESKTEVAMRGWLTEYGLLEHFTARTVHVTRRDSTHQAPELFVVVPKHTWAALQQAQCGSLQSNLMGGLISGVVIASCAAARLRGSLWDTGALMASGGVMGAFLGGIQYGGKVNQLATAIVYRWADELEFAVPREHEVLELRGLCALFHAAKKKEAGPLLTIVRSAFTRKSKL